ncbi:MAG TPA: helix-turn-helix transcriptional regulator [Steroidobacteraceae bacterium]|nr:helix-turn-helix transcriptional regulator [Steroidobacteraceae bacterium]
MPAPKTLNGTLAELRASGSARPRRPVRIPDAAPLIARLLGNCKTLAVEDRANGLAFRLQGTTESATPFAITCVLHLPAGEALLTSAEQTVAEMLCDGRTLAQIAHLRGVSTNTVKSQVRQVFRKLNVESRVALVRRICP